jgi:hypothetical protein
MALPRDTDGEPILTPKMREAIVTALRSYTPAVLHRAVELARKQSWRKAELGPWVFTDESFLALVRKAQDERRTRASTRRAPETVASEAPMTQKEALRASRELVRGLGVRRAG